MARGWHCKSNRCAETWPKRPRGSKCPTCGYRVALDKKEESSGGNVIPSDSVSTEPVSSLVAGHLLTTSGVQTPMFTPSIGVSNGVQTPWLPSPVFAPNVGVSHNDGQLSDQQTVSTNQFPPLPPFHQRMAVSQNVAHLVYIPNLGLVQPVSYAPSMQMVSCQNGQVPQQWNPVPFVPGRMDLQPQNSYIPDLPKVHGYGSNHDPLRSQLPSLMDNAGPRENRNTKKEDRPKTVPEDRLNTEAGSCDDRSDGVKSRKDSRKESSNALGHGNQEDWCFIHHETHKYDRECGSIKHSYKVHCCAEMGWKTAAGYQWYLIHEPVINPVNIRQFLTILEFHWERVIPEYMYHCRKRDREFMYIHDQLLRIHLRKDHLENWVAFVSRMCNITKLAVIEWRRRIFSLANKYVVDVLIPGSPPAIEESHSSTMRQRRHSKAKSAYAKLMEDLMNMPEATTPSIPILDSMAMEHFKALMSCLKQQILFGHMNVMEDARRYLLSNTDLLDKREVKDAFKAIFNLNIKFGDPNVYGISEIKWPNIF